MVVLGISVTFDRWSGSQSPRMDVDQVVVNEVTIVEMIWRL